MIPLHVSVCPGQERSLEVCEGMRMESLHGNMEGLRSDGLTTDHSNTLLQLETILEWGRIKISKINGTK